MNNKIKGLLIGLAALPIAVGCGSDGDSSDSAVEQAEQTQQEVIAAFEEGDADAMNALYAEDAVFENATTGDIRGGQAANLALQNWVAAVTDQDQSEVVEQFVSSDGTRGVVVMDWVGTRSDNGEPFDLDIDARL